MTEMILNNCEIYGIAACVPQQTKYNMNYRWIAADKRKQFIELTGVEQRHVAPKSIATSDMCSVAVRKLLDDAEVSPRHIGILLFVSQSRDYYLPHTSAILQHKLGLPKYVLASDISMGCSGYVYGLSVLGSLLEHSNCEFGLLLAGDVSTLTTPYTDKSTYPLFGDAGTATLVRKKIPSSRAIFTFGNDGSRHEAIIVRNGMCRNRIPKKGFQKKHIGQGIYRSKMDLELNGTDIFHFSVTDVPAHILSLMKKENITVNDVDYFVFHQANKLILQTIAKILKIPAGKMPTNIDRFGNTSSASIPLCMVTEIAGQLKTQKLKLLLSGFGVGLSWGSTLIETDKIHVSELQYIDVS